jgi:hypothetical protein
MLAPMKGLVRTTTEHPLIAAPAETAERVLRDAAPDMVEAFAAHLPDALAGSRRRVGSYLLAYRTLLDHVLTIVGTVRPDLVSLEEERPLILDEKNQPSRIATRIVDLAAAEAPFSRWVSSYDIGSGTALGMLAKLRETLRGVEPLTSESGDLPGFPPAFAGDFERFRADVTMLLTKARQVQELDAMPPLERAEVIFQLNHTDLARLFGVRRQAIGNWQRDGVPANRQDKLSTILAVGDLLTRKLKSDRIPGVVRRKSEVYGGLTMLEMMERDRHEELLESVRELFDWSVTA